MSDEPSFPDPPARRERPKPAPPAPRTKPLMADLVEPTSGAPSSTRVDRRLGCVIPLAVLGLAFVVGGASIVFDWWTKGGTISFYLLILCIAGGPGLLLFARKVYRDPDL